MNSKPSLWLLAAVVATFATFAVSTSSPLAWVLVAVYLSSTIIPSRLPRDSMSVWGLRLFAWGGCAVLARALPATSSPYSYFDARGFLLPGLVMGAEIVVQAWREPPRGLRFDPIIVLLTGLLLLLSSNTRGEHLFLMAPITVFCTLMALRDLRETGKIGLTTRLRGIAILGLACAGGAWLHGQLWANRAQITVLGARLLATQQFTAQGGNPVNDAPQMGSAFASGSSTARLLRIDGTLSDSHLRTAAFATYRNGTWGPSLASRKADAPALPLETRESLLDAQGKPLSEFRTDIDATITVLRPTGNIIFAPLNVSALVPDPKGTTESFNWDRWQGPVKVDDAATPFSYGLVQARSDILGVQTTQGPLAVPLYGLREFTNGKYGEPKVAGLQTPEERAKARAELLEVPPEIDPKVRELAKEITLEYVTQAEKVAAIGEYLLENHPYSLEFTPGTQDPISDFLLNKRAAHCQYFAAGATMLMRSVGIPARYVSGYWAHETAPDGSTLVRGRDAHAWSEAFVSGIGWVTVETTPPAGRADPQVSPSPWYQGTQEWAEDTFAKVRAWFSRLTAWQMGGLMLAMLAMWLGERARQNWKRRRQRAQQLNVPIELAPLVRRFERVLLKRGIILTPGLPWSDALAPELEREARWVELYNRVRFAQNARDEANQLESELRELEKR